MTYGNVARRCVKAQLIFREGAPPLEDHCLVIQGGKIVGFEPSGGAAADIDLGDAAIIPPLVNAHTHLEFSALPAPLPIPAGTFASWIEAVLSYRRSTWPHDSMADTAIVRGAQQSAAHGCWLLGEIATQNDSPQPLLHGPVGGVRFRELIGVRSERVAEALELARDYLTAPAVVGNQADDSNHPQPGWRFLPGLSPHAPYSVSWELLRQAVDLSRKSKVPLAMHLAETREELRLMDRQDGPLVDLLVRMQIWPPAHVARGTRPLDYLKVLAVAHRTLVIHGNYLADDELAFMAAQRDRMTLVFCPRTHAYFGHAPWPWLRARQLGVRVALGTDSRASNPDLSVWREAQFLAEQFPSLASDYLLLSLTRFGREALFGKTEGLTAGANANFCVVRLSQATKAGLPAGEAQDPYRRLFAPASHPIQVWWHGQPVEPADGSN